MSKQREADRRGGGEEEEEEQDADGWKADSRIKGIRRRLRRTNTRTSAETWMRDETPAAETPQTSCLIFKNCCLHKSVSLFSEIWGIWINVDVNIFPQQSVIKLDRLFL